jgi:threonine/homoserine/homoserine lactone efflux protein
VDDRYVEDAGMETFASFTCVATVALLVPGPDTFVVLRTSIADGRRAGTWAAAGSGVGNLLWGTATVAGIAGLLAASAAAFAVLKLAGAAYLMVLGVRALRAAARGELLVTDDRAQREPTARRAFRRGLASDLLNVKTGFFWMALVPQFMQAEPSALLPVAMVLTMAVMAFAWLAAYAYVAGRMSRALSRRRNAVAVNAGLGTVLVAFGLRLALGRH